MGIFGKLLGKGKNAAQTDPREDPNLMQFYDEYGREIYFTREQWRKDILPGNLKSNWNDADALSGLVVSALNDGFAADVLAAGEQLYRLDNGSDRGTCIYAIVLMQNNRLQEAEKLLQDYLKTHGDDGVLLTNLAKVYDAQGQHAEAEATLWRALELDPNQENGFGWYDAIHRERGGDAAALEAQRRVAALPGSWRAQLWLARAALVDGNMAQAVEYYQQCLSRTPQPVPTDVLMQISGDLGNNGRLAEIIQLVKPHFDPLVHGLTVGNNLIKAHIDLHQIDAAQQILEQLHIQKRPDWKEYLNFWDTEIAKARIEPPTPLPDRPLEMELMVIEGPVWLPQSSQFTALFGEKPQSLPVVSFLGSSAEVANAPEQAERQLADAPGRLSRSLPLFLAERVELGMLARSATFFPTIAGEGGGFILAGAAWDDEQALSFVKNSGPSDYVVLTHLQCTSAPWTVQVRVLRTADGVCIGELSTACPPTDPGPAALLLTQELARCLHARTPLQPIPFPARYQAPAEYLGDYLLRLEQLLAVRNAASRPPSFSSLHGEREIIDGNLQLCLAYPENVTVRVLLLQTLAYMKKVKPEVVEEFRERVEKLEREYALAELV